MALPRRIPILLMDGGGWWVTVMKNGLERLSGEYDIRVAQNEADAARECTRLPIRVVILDPDDFACAFLLNSIRKLPGKHMFLLIISSPDKKQVYMPESDKGDALFMARPCPSESVHRQIQSWIFGGNTARSLELSKAYLIRWGFSRTSLAWHYIQYAVLEYLLDDHQPLKSVCATVADRYNTSEKNVQNNIRTAIKRAWEDGHLSDWFPKPPTAKQLLCVLREELNSKL